MGGCGVRRPRAAEGTAREEGCRDGVGGVCGGTERGRLDGEAAGEVLDAASDPPGLAGHTAWPELGGVRACMYASRLHVELGVVPYDHGTGTSIYLSRELCRCEDRSPSTRARCAVARQPIFKLFYL